MPSPATEGERGLEGTLSGERVERRLTALLAADVAGYSRLMGADAEGTLAAPKAIRRELVDPWIVEHRGPPCRDDHGGRDADAAGRCRERWIRQRHNRVAVAATGTAGTSPSGALGMMSTPPPRDHRLYARGNALSKAAGPAVDQYRQWFTTTVYPPLVTKCPLAEIRRATGLSTRYVIMIRKGLGIPPQETISILVAKRSKASIGLN